MPLIPIVGQPVNLVPRLERSFGCNIENKYCVLYGKELATDTKPPETIMFQMEQTPCGDNFIVNGNFAVDETWTHDTDVVFAENKATHIVGAESELSQDISTYLLGSYYRVSFTVSGMSTGKIDLYFTQSGTPTKSILVNGIYTFYLFDILESTNIVFVYSAECNGSISDVSTYKLLAEGDVVGVLLNSDGMGAGAFTVTPIDEFLLFRQGTSGLEDGCYTVEVQDPCFEPIEVLADPQFDDAGAWTVETDCPLNDCSSTISGGQLNQFLGTAGNTVTRASQPFNLFITEPTYLTFLIEFLPINDSQQCGFYVADGSDITELVVFEDTIPPSEVRIYTALFLPGDIDPSNLDMGVFINGTYDSDTDNQNVIVRASITRTPVSTFFTSNCLKVASDVSGTQVVEGFADGVNEAPFTAKSLGFKFYKDLFWLKARLGLSFQNPHSPLKTENNLFSSGRKKKAYAQVAKAWDLVFDAVDESMFDTISNIVNCDRFVINDNEYITDEKEIDPDWGEKSVSPTAEILIEVQKVIGTRFNTNV